MHTCNVAKTSSQFHPLDGMGIHGDSVAESSQAPATAFETPQHPGHSMTPFRRLEPLRLSEIAMCSPYSLGEKLIAQPGE